MLGAPDPVIGEALEAIVVPVEADSLTEKAVIKHCARPLEDFMVPNEIEFLGSLPKTSTDKIIRKNLWTPADPDWRGDPQSESLGKGFGFTRLDGPRDHKMVSGKSMSIHLGSG